MKYMNKAILIPILCALRTPACLDIGLDDIKDQIEDQLGDSFGEYAVQGTWEIGYDNLPDTSEWMTFEVGFSGMELVDFRSGPVYEWAEDLTSTITYSQFQFTLDGHLQGQVDRSWSHNGHDYTQIAEIDLRMNNNQTSMVGELHWFNSRDEQPAGEGHESVTFSLDSY